MRRALTLALALAATPALLADPQVDLEPLFERLESIGLRTAQARRVLSEIEVHRFEDDPDDPAMARYEWGDDDLLLPSTYCVPGTHVLRADLEPDEIGTVIHELSHAEYDTVASEDAPRGNVDYIHWDCVNTIWAQLFTAEDQQTGLPGIFGLASYPRMKADEVSSYFIGKSIQQVFRAVSNLVAYNVSIGSKHVASVEEANELGGTLLLPRPEDDDAISRMIRGVDRFGRVSVRTDAHFQATGITSPKPIGWDEAGNDWLKDRMYRYILGLFPPATMQELVDRLNALPETGRRGAWIRGVRARVAAARRTRARLNATR